MANPFLKITQAVQQDHNLWRDDVSRLPELEVCLDPRVVHHCKMLKAHKKLCPICSWPRMYPFIRKTNRMLRKVLLKRIG